MSTDMALGLPAPPGGGPVGPAHSASWALMFNATTTEFSQPPLLKSFSIPSRKEDRVEEGEGEQVCWG